MSEDTKPFAPWDLKPVDVPEKPWLLPIMIAEMEEFKAEQVHAADAVEVEAPPARVRARDRGDDRKAALESAKVRFRQAGEPVWRPDVSPGARLPFSEPRERVNVPPKLTPSPAPAQRQAPEAEQSHKRIGRASYNALESHGFYGLIDEGSDGLGCRVLVAHVPKGNRHHTIEVRPGDTISALSTTRKGVGANLRVRYIARHRYYAPGTRISTLSIGVEEQDWQQLERAR